MNIMEDFFNKVYEIVKKIPPGRVTSYGAIAAALGVPGAARMVGWAMNASHHANFYVPAHRVVNRNGLLTGKHHFETSSAMEELLEGEGIKVSGNRIEDFSKHFWDPLKESGMDEFE